MLDLRGKGRVRWPGRRAADRVGVHTHARCGLEWERLGQRAIVDRACVGRCRLLQHRTAGCWRLLALRLRYTRDSKDGWGWSLLLRLLLVLLRWRSRRRLARRRRHPARTRAEAPPMALCRGRSWRRCRERPRFSCWFDRTCYSHEVEYHLATTRRAYAFAGRCERRGGHQLA